MGNIQKIKPSGIFTNYIFKSIPLAFDESLSYYEVLCGILDLLKTQEEVINNNADLLAELESYVKDYFKNLDVQEEINNKLDEMAENGELTDIIAQYLQLAGMLVYNTLNDLKNAENITNGSSVMTLGYYAIGDGGSAKYKIRQVINTDTPNDENIIALHDENLVAEIIIDNNTLNVKQFGAKGDGLTDDSSIIQNAIDYCSANNYKVYIDSDTYLIETGLLINNDNSLLECDGTLKINSNITCININGFNQRIKVNKLLSNNRTGIGFKSNGKLGYSDIEFAFIDDFDKGISLDTSLNSTDGILYNYIKNNTIIANTGIYLNANTRYINNNFFYLGYIGGGTAIVSEEITNLVGEYNGNIFNNIGFENLTKCLDLNNFDDNTFKDFRIYESITGNKFITLNNCKNNLFQSNTTSAILQNDKIEDNTTRNNANIFECRITQYANVNSEYARKCLSYNNHFEIIENGNLNTYEWLANGSYNTSVFGSLHAITQICTYNSESDTTFTLGEEYNYDNFYTRNLTLFVSYIGATTSLQIYNSNNTKIFDIDDFRSVTVPGKSATFKFQFVNGVLVPYMIDHTE